MISSSRRMAILSKLNPFRKRTKKLRDAIKQGKNEELRKSEAKYRSLVESSGAGVSTTDIRGRFTYVNKALCKMIGYSKEELIGKSFSKFLHPDDKKNLLPKFLGAWKHPRRLYHLKFRIIHKNGKIVHMHSTPTIFFHRHQIAGFNAIIDDITDQERMEEELRESEENYKNTSAFLDSILSNISDYVFLIDEDYIIQFQNKAAKDLHGDLIRKRCYKALRNRKSPCHHAGIPCEVNEILKKGEENFEDVHQDDVIGKIFHIRAKPAETMHGKRTIIMLSRDITDEKRAENAMKKIEEEKTRSIIKDQFISVATHELRTPLISIKGYVDYVLTGKFGPISKNVDSSLNIVKRNTDRLLALTEDLLDIRRIESGRIKMKLKFLDFRDILKHCIMEIQPFIEDKKQNFNFDIPKEELKVQGDSIRLSQAVMNLLNNANKFTPEGGKIVLHVEKKSYFIQIQISDTGGGIYKEDLERIFQPFVDIKKRTYIKGTGLGLSVTKGLVEAHGGKIWAESEGEGKGTTFIFTLPRIN